MPDNSLEILITTRADLAGAKAAEAQLDQDAAKARALGDAYDDLDSKLKSMPEDGNVSGENDPTGIRQNDGIKSDLNNPPDEPSSILNDRPAAKSEGRPTASTSGSAGAAPAGEDVLSRFQTGIEGLRLAVEALSKILGTAKNSDTASDEKPVEIFAEHRPPVPGRGPEDRTTGDTAPGMERESAPFSAGQDGAEPSGAFAESQAQAIQSAGDRMRAALEQNAQVTVALFNRTLELISEQTRKMGDVDRKITELSGQIKSLKNL